MAKGSDGKALEQVVGIIEQAIAGNENVTVEVNKRLTDKTNGEPRQHDVLVTIRSHHQTVLMSFECKDWSRPVGVKEIEAFSKKCQHTGIDKGIVVSTSGFAKTARKTAAFLGISCLDMEEVASLDWLQVEGIHFIERKLLGHSWLFVPETLGVVDHANMELLDDQGNVVTKAVLAANARMILREQLPPVPPPTEKKELVFRVIGQGLSLRNSKTGATTPVRYGEAKVTYSVVHSLAPFSLVQYVEKADDKHISDAAVTELPFGDQAMRVIMVHKEGKGGKIYLAPARKKISGKKSS